MYLSLKLFGKNIPIQTKLPKLDKEVRLILKPDEVMDNLFLYIKNRMIMEYLTKWNNMPLK